MDNTQQILSGLPIKWKRFLTSVAENILVISILSAVVLGDVGLIINTSRKITRAGVHFIFTTLMSVTIGLILVRTLKPWGDAHDVIGYNSEGDGGFSTYTTERQEFDIPIARVPILQS